MTSLLIFLVIVTAALVGKVIMVRKDKQSSRPTSEPSGATNTTTEQKVWKCWLEKYWTRDEAKIIPIIVCVGMIDYLLFTEWPTYVWGPVMGSWKKIVIVHVFYIVALTCINLGSVWKKRTAYILITLCVITVTTTLGITPLLGENGWTEKPEDPPSTTHQATTTPTAPPREYIVTAPVGGWSDRIPIVIGTIIRPEMGKPILIRDDRGIIHKDSADGSMKDPFTSSFVEVQSSNREPVTVTVSR